jgi:hypothetical protein
MVSHQNGHSRTMMVILPRCSDIRPNWIKGYQDDGHIYSRADVNEYIPGIATACWVPSDKVQEGDRIWLLIGGQVMGLAKAGTDDANGWRSVWWFSNGAKLPLCMCACLYTLSVYLRWITGLYEPSRS